ncbi:MAG TPA: ROK family protein [Chitinophagaceae bacterium]|nr:ROK family protein [Chitinophagaceae bacterium]
MGRIVIGIDIGGSNIKGVLLNEQGEVLLQQAMPTNDNGEGSWRSSAIEMVNLLKAGHEDDIKTIGISSPGLANKENNAIAYLPDRLTGIENFNWDVQFNAQTFVINDAHAALLAEKRFGCLKGYRNAVLLTLGTGVGGAILINGELYQGEDQMAGHFGHTCITAYDDERSIVGMPGSLEYALGNYSVQRRSFGRYATTHEVVRAYEQNEPFATWLWLDMMRKLALTIASISNSLAPEAVVLAGGITQATDSLLQPLHSFLDIYEYRPNNKRTKIKMAQFTDLSGAIGAAAFAFSKTEKTFQ